MTASKPKNYMVALFASALPSAFGFLFFPLYAKALGPAAYGIIALLETCQSITSILMFMGMTTSFYVFYSHATSCEDKKKILSTSLFFGCLLFIFLALVSPLFPQLNSALVSTEGNWLYFAIYSFSIFPDYILSIVTALLRSEGKIGSIALNTSIITGVQHALCLSAVFLFAPSLKLFMIAFFLAKLFILIFCFTRMAHLNISFALSCIDFSKLKEMLRFGSPLILTSVTGWTLLLSDRLFINAYGSFKDVGIYAVAYKLSMGLSLALVQPFMSVWEPALFKLFAQDQEKGYLKLKRDFNTYIAALVALFGAMLLFMEDFLQLVFANSLYTQGTSLFPFLIASQLLMAIGEMWGTICRLNKTSQFAYGVTFVALGTKLVLNGILIPPFLLIGAAIASFIAEIFGQGMMAYYAYKFSRPKNLCFFTPNIILVSSFFALQGLVTFFPVIPFIVKLCLFLVLLLICKKQTLAEGLKSLYKDKRFLPQGVLMKKI